MSRKLGIIQVYNIRDKHLGGGGGWSQLAYIIEFNFNIDLV